MNATKINELADFLDSLNPNKFTQDCFRLEEESYDARVCTYGDAVGWAAFLWPDEVDYGADGEILFWDIPQKLLHIKDDFADNYCFSGHWVDVDNTPTGCAERLRAMLKNGEAWARAEYKKTFPNQS